MPDESGSGQSNQTTPAPIEIDGKSYTVDDIKNVLTQQAEVTQKSQLASKALTAAERYQVDVDTYVQNAEASFALMNELIQQGVIDESGKIKKEEAKPVVAPNLQAAGLSGVSKANAVSAEALVEFHKKFGSLEAELERLKEDNVGLMRLRLQDKLGQQFPDLDEDDIAKVMATAYKANGKKPVVEVAKEMSEAKKTWMLKQEETFAKKYGLNLDEINKRKQFIESDPSQGAGMLAQGKKISFSTKKGDTNVVTPKEAMAEFMRRRLES
jgi:hypothetical protein